MFIFQLMEYFSLGSKACNPILLLKLLETPVVGSMAMVFNLGGVYACK